ncbi:hypothetical protein K488DRAFT_22400, partial [Vararia minispora EC-137]
EQAATWVRSEGKSDFHEAIPIHATVKERLFHVMALFVPLHFQPEQERDLREIEHVNQIDPESIIRARWVKPTHFRREGQEVGHAILTFASAETANKLLLNGMVICGKRISGTKMKKEPIRCLKCQTYGHFANACMATEDTCGKCGEKHRTADCKNPFGTFCVSCQTNDHASRDRVCPEFQRKCEAYDSHHPENGLAFFPTDEPWTWA